MHVSPDDTVDWQTELRTNWNSCAKAGKFLGLEIFLEGDLR